MIKINFNLLQILEIDRLKDSESGFYDKNHMKEEVNDRKVDQRGGGRSPWSGSPRKCKKN